MVCSMLIRARQMATRSASVAYAVILLMVAPLTVSTLSRTGSLQVSITLEELGLPYKVHVIKLMEGEHKSDWFMKVSEAISTVRGTHRGSCRDCRN